jgi:hypothetical protein
VTVSLLDPAGRQVASFPPFSQKGTWGPNTYTLPPTVGTVGVGTYRVQAQQDARVTAIAINPLTVAVPTGGQISGIAQCPLADGPPTLLRGATVQLLSGADVVATTRASLTDASYSFSGVASESIFGLRYIPQSEGPPIIACGTAVTTNSDGFATVPPPARCPNPDRQNRSWDSAFQLTSGVPVTDFICKPNQSIWMKLAITPGSTVSVAVTGGSSRTRVALFKDLRKEGDLLLDLLASGTPLNVRQLTASMPGLQGAPWDSEPWDSEPWDSEPWDSEPWDSEPWNSSPWDSEPWDSEPCPTNVCAKDGPIYSAAEQRALLAVSRHGHITRNTWDNTGDYFIRVYNIDAFFDPTQALSITATRGPVCGTGTLTFTPASTNLSGNPTTLILTNTARLKDATNELPLTDPSNSAQLAAFNATLQTLASHPAVRGLVVDFAGDGGLKRDYDQWDAQPSCVPAANLVSDAIHDVIAKYRSQPGSALQYVTIVAGHTGLPFRLIPDYAEIEKEKRYNPGLDDLSESKATLASSYVMSDNFYVSFVPISHLESEINLPEPNLGIGRLVESPDDITNVIQAFLDNNGQLVPQTALTTGYTFVKDLATFERDEFQKSGLITDSLISDSWTMADLKGKLFAPAGRFDIIAVNWHASANIAVAADYDTNHPTVLRSGDIVDLTVDARFRNVLVMSLGCHLGYNLVDADVLGQPLGRPVTDPRDFTQVLANQGAMVLANTGYGYGDTDFMGYGERLLGIVTQELEFFDQGTSPQPVPVGLALTRAKRAYVNGSTTLTGVDKKTVEQLTFYGLPMWSVALPTRTQRPAPSVLQVRPVVRGSGLSAGDVIPGYTLAPHDIVQDDATARYFSADGGTAANNSGSNTLPFRPVLPFKSFDVSSPADGTMRGAALLAADYGDVGSFNPAVTLPVTETDTSRHSRGSGGFAPSMPFGTNHLVDQSLVLTPYQFSSSPGSRTARVYGNSGLKLRVYYSNIGGAAALAGPASIGDVTLTANGTLVHVDATITGATITDVADLLVSYTAVGRNSINGQWLTCNLVPRRSDTPGNTASCPNAGVTVVSRDANSFTRHYFADIETAGTGAAPADLRLLIQAVTGTGLVSMRLNDGQYFQVIPRTATVSSPKKSTVLRLSPPVNPTPFDHTATFSANLVLKGDVPIADQTVLFTVGSQQKTALTDREGIARVSMVLQGLPNTYQVVAAFAETPSLLPSSTSSDLKIVKKETRVAFGPTPFLATLRDADNRLMREQMLFFTVTGHGVSQTVASLTTANGVGRLSGLTVPPGSYSVTVRFLGQVPYDDTGLTANIVDERYSPSSATTTLVVDRTPPRCDLTSVDPDKQIIAVEIQDASGSGLASVSATELVNATLSIPTYDAGVLSALKVTATKIDPNLASQLGLEVVDVAGNVTFCDPVAVLVGAPRSVTIRDVKSSEHFVVIYNGRPGLHGLQVKVNRRTWHVQGVRPGEVRTLDIAPALYTDDHNTVILTAEGPPGGSALVLISDMAPASAAARRAQPERSAPINDVDLAGDPGDHSERRTGSRPGGLRPAPTRTRGS